MKHPIVMTLALIAAALLAGSYFLWTPDKPRAWLEGKYLRATTDYVEVAGLRLHVRDSGAKDAPTVVMIHGFGSSLHTWEAWASILSADFRVVRFDLPGSGLSQSDPTGDYSDARSIEVLLALMDKLQVSRASLIGNSIGGRIAWKFAATQPARVTKLVLISPDGFASPGFEYGQKAQIPAALSLLRYVLPRQLLRMNLLQAYGNPAALTDATLARYYDLMLAPGARTAMLERLAQTVLEDPEPFLRRIQAPTLLLWGEQDHLIPIANSADYLRLLPNAILVRLPGLGHVPQEEAPRVALEPVSKFLTQ